MSQPMDESFEYFYNYKGLGPAVHSQAVPEAVLQRFRGKLPNQLLTWWRLYGWSGYGEGRFWFVNPDEYEPVLEAWIGDTRFMEEDAYYVFARSAFGDVELWGRKSGDSLTINGVNGLIFPKDDSAKVASGRSDGLMSAFLIGLGKDELDRKDHLNRPLFERALKKLGPLGPDEMYGFEPALCLGGKADLKNLQKVKAVEHLVLLAQLGERKIMRDIVKDARGQGASF